jgi:hypothetical protein
VYMVEAPSGEAVRPAVVEAFSRGYLVSVISQQNLYPAERTQRPLEDIVHDMQKHIRVMAPPRGPNASQTGRVAMEVAFEHGDPHVAQRVTQALTYRLIETLARTAHSSSLRVIDPADLPGTPVRPNIPNVIVAGAIAGLITGLVVVLIVKMKKGQRPALPPSAA